MQHCYTKEKHPASDILSYQGAKCFAKSMNRNNHETTMTTHLNLHDADHYDVLLLIMMD